MKIGVRAHDYGKMPVARLLHTIKQDGFNTIQLAIPKVVEGVNEFDEITPELINKIKQISTKEEIEISVYGCYIEPAHLDEDKRHENINKFIKNIEHAKALGAHCIGTETTRFAGEECERELAFGKLVDSVSKMVKKAEEVGIDIGIEPVAYHTLATPKLTKRLLDTINSPRLKVIFDPVNLITKENINNQKDLWNDCFELFGDKICAVHIKGIKQDERLELQKAHLFESEIDFGFLLKEIVKRYPDIHVLREEAIPDLAKADQEYIKKQFKN